MGETLGSQLDDLHFIRAHEILGFRTKAFLLGPAEGAHVPHGAGRWKRSVGRVARGGPRDEPVMYEGRATGTRGGGARAKMGTEVVGVRFPKSGALMVDDTYRYIPIDRYGGYEGGLYSGIYTPVDGRGLPSKEGSRSSDGPPQSRRPLGAVPAFSIRWSTAEPSFPTHTSKKKYGWRQLHHPDAQVLAQRASRPQAMRG